MSLASELAAQSQLRSAATTLENARMLGHVLDHSVPFERASRGVPKRGPIWLSRHVTDRSSLERGVNHTTVLAGEAVTARRVSGGEEPPRDASVAVEFSGLRGRPGRRLMSARKPRVSSAEGDNEAALDESAGRPPAVARSSAGSCRRAISPSPAPTAWKSRSFPARRYPNGPPCGHQRPHRLATTEQRVAPMLLRAEG